MPDIWSEIEQNLGSRSALRLNAIFDANGNWIFNTKLFKQNIDNDADKKMLNLLRANSDLIVTSGATARAENYQASMHAPLAVITRNLEPIAKEFHEASEGKQPVVLVSPTVAFETETRIPCDDPLRVGDLLESFKKHGWKRILLECGPSLFEIFEPSTDEICMTTPSIEASNKAISNLTNRKTEKLTQFDLNGFWFTRYSVL